MYKARILVLTVMLTSPLSASENGGFQALSVKGEVFYWPIFGNAWHQVKAGMIIPKDAIVVVTKDAALSYKAAVKSVDRITINVPLTFRISANVIREVKTKNVQVSSLYATSFATETKAEDATTFSMTGAFNRIAYFIESGGGMTPSKDRLSQRDASGEVVTTFSAKAIQRNNNATQIGKMISPRAGQVLVRQDALESFEMRWSYKGQGPFAAEIWLWQKGDRPTPIGRTMNQRYVIQLKEFGEYNALIQVKQGDEIREIGPVVFRVEPPLRPAREGIDRVKLRRIFPPHNSLLTSQNFPVHQYIGFHPTDPSSAIGVKYKLVVTNGDQTIYEQVRRDEPIFVVRIPYAGHYQWSLHIWRREGESRQSHPYSFTISAEPTLVKDLKEGTLFLDQGL